MKKNQTLMKDEKTVSQKVPSSVFKERKKEKKKFYQSSFSFLKSFQPTQHL